MQKNMYLRFEKKKVKSSNRGEKKKEKEESR
jgi:hypothetical protein